MNRKLLGVFLASLFLLAAAHPAQAFCGFYVSGADAPLGNDATLAVMMRQGTRTVLSMQNTYAGPPQDFALVVPVPVVLHEKNVKVLPRDIFAKVDRLTAPRLVEYWEQDPCVPPVEYAMAPPNGAPMAPMEDSNSAAHHVKIEARFAVGEYDVVVLSAQDSSGLDAWLRDNHYKIPDGAEPYLRPYVQMGMKFFVAKVNVAKVKFERSGQGKEHAVLSPLRFHYDADDFFLPVRLGLINSSGKQDLVTVILARGQRYEVANYDNVSIPTNLEVTDATRQKFGSFYASLFDRVVERHPHAVVTEYSWDAASCDPCPIPPLEDADLATLGADVLPDSGAPGSTGFVVTRLHARYGRDTLGDDLHFRPATPIVGGREGMEEGAKPDSTNNFQARYVIRHKWVGKVACESPMFGQWGGPPDGKEPLPVPALDVAFAARDADLGALVKTPLPDGLALARGDVVGPPRIPPAGGCAGCSAGTRNDDFAAIGLCAVTFLAMTWRRRR